MIIWLIIILCVGIIASYFIMRGMGAILIIADPLSKADAAVALSGDDGERVSAAIDLYYKGFVTSLVITYTDPQASQLLINEAVGLGFPVESIYVTKARVSDTVEEALAVRQLAGIQGIDSLIIITDPYHTLRTRVIFRRELRESGIAVQVRPVSGHWYRSDSWWMSSDGLRFTIEEYVKIFFYLIGVH
ncbi:MAG: YdcF family protein [Chloroflexota bacterium]